LDPIPDGVVRFFRYRLVQHHHILRWNRPSLQTRSDRGPLVSFGPRPRPDTSDTGRFPLASSVSIPYLQPPGRPCPCEDGNGARLRRRLPLPLLPPSPAPPLPPQAEVAPASPGLERHDWRSGRGPEGRGSGEEGGRFEGARRFSASRCCFGNGAFHLLVITAHFDCRVGSCEV
jgi:hypothetical protein